MPSLFALATSLENLHGAWRTVRRGAARSRWAAIRSELARIDESRDGGQLQLVADLPGHSPDHAADGDFCPVLQPEAEAAPVQAAETVARGQHGA